MTQERLLSSYSNDEDNIEKMLEYNDIVEESPDEIHLFEDNPLHSAYYLYQINTGEGKEITTYDNFYS